jgi:hypothetical protein
MSSSLTSGIPPSLFTACTSRTHETAPQTDFPVKHDNLLGLPTTARQKGLCMRKRSSSPKSTEKASRTPSCEMTTQAKHRPTLLYAHSARESRPRPEGQHRGQDGTPTSTLRAMERAWKVSRGLHGSMPQTSKPSKLSFDRSRIQAFGIGVDSPPDSDAGPNGNRII